MATYRKQKYLTITDEQAELLMDNVGKMTLEKLAIFLGLPKGKMYQNMRVLKLTHKGQRRKPVKHYTLPKKETCKVVDFNRNGYFDEEKFFKEYAY